MLASFKDIKKLTYNIHTFWCLNLTTKVKFLIANIKKQ
jgi:hypothetical protein